MSNKSLDLIQSWLELQCRVVPGTIRAVVLFPESSGSHYRPVAGWPAGTAATPALSNAAATALQKQQLVLRDSAVAQSSSGQEGDIVACPLLRGDDICGVVAVEVSQRETEERQMLAETLRNGSAWLELLLTDRSSIAESRLLSIVEIVGATLEHEQYFGAASAFVTQLAARLRCDRVSLGFRRGNHVRVDVMSRSVSLDSRTKLVASIAAAMEESIDQDSSVVYPGSAGGRFQVARAHEELATQHGAGSVCSVPIVCRSEILGAVTFEHENAARFESEMLAFCETVVALVGPILEDRRQRAHWLGGRLAREARELATRLFGPGHFLAKFAAAATAALLAAAVLVTSNYRVTADATLEGTIQRAVVAPFDGFIAEASVRPGDFVEDGQVLAALDDNDLTLQRLKLASEKSQYEKELREAIAAHESAQVAILRAQLDKATAELDLIEEHLARTRVVAPIDGVVIDGDLSQSLGAPVERGDPLFEIAPLDSYRVMLEVDETQVGDVAPGQNGQLALAGYPADLLDFVVERVTPISTAADGRNFFAIEASLIATPDSLRPGMQGVGKIEIGERRLIWIWTRSLVQWLRLWSWTWFG